MKSQLYPKTQDRKVTKNNILMVLFTFIIIVINYKKLENGTRSVIIVVKFTLLDKLGVLQGYQTHNEEGYKIPITLLYVSKMYKMGSSDDDLLYHS